MARQTWSSRLTYIMTVAGATIGFGATWRFPYLVGENGGGAYVLMLLRIPLTLKHGSSLAIWASSVLLASCLTTCQLVAGLSHMSTTSSWVP